MTAALTVAVIVGRERLHREAVVPATRRVVARGDGAVLSVATTCPLTEKSTFETVRPEVVAVHVTEPLTVCPSERFWVTVRGARFRTVAVDDADALLPSVAVASTRNVYDVFASFVVSRASVYGAVVSAPTTSLDAERDGRSGLPGRRAAVHGPIRTESSRSRYST